MFVPDESLFTFSGRGVKFTKKGKNKFKLTTNDDGVYGSNSVDWFTNIPKRQTGVISRSDFARNFEDLFPEESPNAAISWTTKSGKIKTSIVELIDVKSTFAWNEDLGHNLSITVKGLDNRSRKNLSRNARVSRSADSITQFFVDDSAQVGGNNEFDKVSKWDEVTDAQWAALGVSATASIFGSYLIKISAANSKASIHRQILKNIDQYFNEGTYRDQIMERARAKFTTAEYFKSEVNKQAGITNYYKFMEEDNVVNAIVKLNRDLIEELDLNWEDELQRERFLTAFQQASDVYAESYANALRILYQKEGANGIYRVFAQEFKLRLADPKIEKNMNILKYYEEYIDKFFPDRVEFTRKAARDYIDALSENPSYARNFSRIDSFIDDAKQANFEYIEGLELEPSFEAAVASSIADSVVAEEIGVASGELIATFVEEIAEAALIA